MKEILKIELTNLLESDVCQSILNSEEFYFEKAQTILQTFLDLEISNELRQYLLENRKDYNSIKSILEKEEIGTLIFSIISYCDTKAYNKNIYNLYEDKRVLALAFVRMNNWVEQLLTYKFEGTIQDGSVKNAIEYLLDPSENFTMLSEGHRTLICNNLFDEEYDNFNFKKYFIDFFSILQIELRNELNRTHLLSRLAYMIESLWKESIVGLVSPDRTGWQETAIEKTKNGEYIVLWNHKRPNGTEKTFKLLRSCINENGFFRVFYTSNKEVNYVAEIVDFVTDQEQLLKCNWESEYGAIIDCFNSFDDYTSDDKKASWLYLARNIYKVDADIYSDFRYLNDFGYPSVGCQAPVVSFNSNVQIKSGIEMKKEIDILKYKKQIILQGPPGTGKTKLAKDLAKELIGFNDSAAQISEKDITDLFKVGMNIKTVEGDAEYEIVEVLSNRIKSKKKSGTIDETLFKNILLAYDEQLWDSDIRSNPNRRAKAFAKFVYDNHDNSRKINSGQFKLIQFHPSYTYEDFVRGIVSKPNDDGDGIVYEAENKLLADFAKKAFDNYNESNKTNVVFSEETSVFDAFIDIIKDELAQNENHKYDITEAVYLFSADETRFKYKGDNWVAHSKGLNMKFSELKKIIESGATERQDIKKMTDVEELTRQHATYFIKIVEKYYDFKKTFKESNPTQVKIGLKNYVLIIDEINRANLSSVLGELIYALEYRGEEVESMYKIGEDNKLILPPNLYIIGTMNTADRSVGHIDYAIRRRFAFVDVLPKDLSSEENILFDSELFYQVEKLFETNLSPEFVKKDVQLGHSYFIDKTKDGGSMNIRLEYEIKPILSEYVKDGVLIGDDIKKLIEDLEPSI